MIGRDEEALPEGFKLIYGPSWRLGSLQLAARDTPAAFWVEARGFIIPRLIRLDLEYASAFGRGHPEGWDYVVDTRRVRVVHPWNLVELRKLRRLPHFRNWLVIARPGLSTTLLGVAPSSIRPDHIVRDSGEALERLEYWAGEGKDPTVRSEKTI